MHEIEVWEYATMFEVLQVLFTAAPVLPRFVGLGHVYNDTQISTWALKYCC